jgi:ubiquinone/menaquinone biosynthesis C-methylase UbiE
MEYSEYTKMYELEDSHWWFLGKRKIAEKMIARYVPLTPQDRILDVGCGTGGMMKVLREHGQVFGVDICSLGLELARGRGFDSLSQGSALGLPFADNTFALITSFDVLYHEEVGNDALALREYYRLCRPGGSLLITDSALPILYSQHDQAYHGSRRYTARDLRRKVTQAGFQVLKLSYMNMLLFPFVFAIRMTKRYAPGNTSESSDLHPVSPLLNSILFAIYGLEGSLLTRANLPVGSSLLCVARKPPNQG